MTQTHRPEGIVEYILINYRWVFVCFFLLPISFVYDIWFYFRNYIVFALSSAPKQHDNKVKRVQKQVSRFSLVLVSCGRLVCKNNRIEGAKLE